MGSACGLRFIGPSTPFGVCPGVRPGVRSAGDALMAEVVKRGVRGVRGVELEVRMGIGARETGATGAQWLLVQNMASSRILWSSQGKR